MAPHIKTVFWVPLNEQRNKSLFLIRVNIYPRRAPRGEPSIIFPGFGGILWEAEAEEGRLKT